MTNLGGLFSNPIWRAKNSFTHMGDANAPTLWDFDSNGYASPSNNRPLSNQEQQWLDSYNALRRATDKAYWDAFDATFGAGWFRPHTILTTCNRDFTTAANSQPPRDPLVLDLDGDGIETVGIFGASGTGSPILFDHDANGTRTGTGWIAPDDALLVRDIDGNGSIDSGRELFGDNTLLPNGQTATNGFTALQQHDSNGDGQVNSQDAIFSQLRVWRDLNQDGVSQANELQTLAQAGIASIGVVGTATNTNLGNGNTQIAAGSFTRTNGATGQSGVAELAGSLLLSSNNFYREFTDNPPLSTAALALPQMRGSGTVRDLRVRGCGSRFRPRASIKSALSPGKYCVNSYQINSGLLLQIRPVAAIGNTLNEG
jgi:hypothetical protein